MERKTEKVCWFCGDQKASVLMHIYTAGGEYLSSYPSCNKCLEWKRRNLFRFFRYESTPIRVKL